MKYWYALNDEDIRTVADELEVKLNGTQIKKIKERTPDHIDWFGAIEMAITEVMQTPDKPKCL